MPYRKPSEINVPGVDRLDPEQQRAFMVAFNDCYERGHEEARCYKIAWHAARQIDESLDEDMDTDLEDDYDEDD